jgi:hypothetical protein
MAPIADIAASGVFARRAALTTRSSRFETTIWLPSADRRRVGGEGRLLRGQFDYHQECDHARAIASISLATTSLSLTVIPA